MRPIIRRSAVILLFMPILGFAVRDGLVTIEPEMAKRFGKLLSDEADKIEKPQVKIMADPDKASGVHAPEKVGALIVPQKNLQFNEELAAKFKEEKGAPIAYLFLYHLSPVLEGKTTDATRLREVKIPDENGQQHTVHVVLLSVRQLSDDDYRLYVWGQGDKPLVEGKFAEGTGPGPEPTAVEVKDISEQSQQGKLVVTVFGKYQAGFQVGYRAD